MNILPKKRWHVRTKENIARVRKDEAEAADKEKQEKLRIDQADRERRLSLLKLKSQQNLESLQIIPTQSNEELNVSENETTNKHINLFTDIEHATTTTNREHDREIIEKKEQYEKKIGYLTYLGQDTNEALGKKNWYEILPDSSRFTRPEYVKDTYDKLVLKDEDGKPKKKKSDEKDGEVGCKSKQRYDPIYAFKKDFSKIKASKKEESFEYNKKSEHRKKKNKDNLFPPAHSKNKVSDKEDKIKKLREARLKREQQEKQRTTLFLTKLSGAQTTSEEVEQRAPKIVPKYNSQFNPELARQNYI